MIKSIEIFNDYVKILDQTKLPLEETYLEITDYKEMIEAIKKLKIRGAPALGIAAAATAYLALKKCSRKNYSDYFEKVIKQIEESRPTAVNLFMATRKIKDFLLRNKKINKTELEQKVFNYTEQLTRKEIKSCLDMAENGLKLFPKKRKLSVLTHCNTGSLATVGIGTALGLIRKLNEVYDLTVFVDETRPLLQGSRLTMWELLKDRIKARLISDNMAAHIVQTRKIDAIMTGADRIAQNGDSANKIGTMNLAILAKHFEIPFYIVAPETTIDKNISSGKEISIEQRNKKDVTCFNGLYSAPPNSPAENPAFDVTPAKLINAIITDKKNYFFPYNFS